MLFGESTKPLMNVQNIAYLSNVIHEISYVSELVWYSPISINIEILSPYAPAYQSIILEQEHRYSSCTIHLNSISGIAVLEQVIAR